MIDHEALAKAAHALPSGRNLPVPWERIGGGERMRRVDEARAVVAALRDQGLVVVQRDDALLVMEAVKEAGMALAEADGCDGDETVWRDIAVPEVVAAFDRIAAMAEQESHQ